MDPARFNSPAQDIDSAEGGGGRGDEGNVRTPPSDRSCNETEEEEEEEEEEEGHACRLCPRTFRSMKALHGHMRIHNARNRKGIDPPLTYHCHQAEPSAPKRKRDDELFCYDDCNSAEIIAICRGALDLLHLQSHGQWQRTHPTAQAALSDDPTDEEVYTFYNLQHRRQQQRVHVVAVETDQPVAPAAPCHVDKKYTCTTCRRSFSSHQALGGHTAGHKEYKNSSVQRGATDSKQDAQSQAAAGSERTHRCDQCPMSFRTGQALGGHKRAHYGKKKSAEQDNASHEPVINVAAQAQA